MWQLSIKCVGALVAARFRPVLAEVDQATEDVADANRSDLGRLQINAPMSLAMRVLQNLIDRFRLAFPRIDLELHLTDKLVDIIAEDCDLAIRVSRCHETS